MKALMCVEMKINQPGLDPYKLQSWRMDEDWHFVHIYHEIGDFCGEINNH